MREPLTPKRTDSDGTPDHASGSRFSSVEHAAHLHWMRIALDEAGAAGAADEVPVGAVIVGPAGEVARGRNRIRGAYDPTGHAEMIALRAAASAVGDARLRELTLYVTLEPCAMCAGAILLARLRSVVFGAYDPKAGMCGSLANIVQDPRLNHRVDLHTGIMADECGEVLRQFFRDKRRGPSLGHSGTG